ncbi:MAG TPA: class I SAM-dependent methyltransferase [bacterium]|nr:class I SAM-dependent methyltransferase [bacterium]
MGAAGERNDPTRWTEADSERFAELGEVIVPARAEQLAAIRGLIPAGSDEEFTMAELGAGDGTLASLVLERFPRCRYLALDGSAAMRERARVRLAPFAPRVEIRHFELARVDWRRTLPGPLRCVVSSLVVHHLSAEGKRALFADLAVRLESGGALLIADLVEAAGPRAAGLFAAQWDEAVRDQSAGRSGGLSALEQFTAGRWNYYRLDTPDPVDQPSRLIDQLDWLRGAGFPVVDCFWMRAGHAIFGGYRGGGTRRPPP